MAFYSYLSTKIIIAFITKSYQDLFGVRSYINAFAIILITKTYFDNIYATPIKLFFKWAGHNTIIILGLSQIISTYIKIGFSYFSVPEIMNPFLRHIFLWIILYILSIIIRKYFPRIIGQK